MEKFSNVLLRLEFKLNIVVARHTGLELLAATHFDRGLTGTAKVQVEIYWSRLLARLLDHLSFARKLLFRRDDGSAECCQREEAAGSQRDCLHHC